MCFFALNDNFTLCTIDYFFALLNFVSINNYYCKMGRTKGTTKTGGRKKGSKNKTGEQQKEWILTFLSKGSAAIDKFWNDKNTTLEAKINLYASIAPKLASFVMAKQTESKISFDEEMSKAIKESSDKLNSLFKQENK